MKKILGAIDAEGKVALLVFKRQMESRLETRMPQDAPLEEHCVVVSNSRFPEAAPKSEYNLSLQGFRGFAASCVFVFHIFSANVLPPFGFILSFADLRYAASSLRYGVELFFMISGYVILGSLRRHRNLKAFFIDRVLRIYPAWIPVHLLVFTVGPIVGWGLFKGVGPLGFSLNFLSNLLFLPTVLPFPLAHWAAWSLSYEWAFYGIAALVMVAITKTSRLKTLSFGAIAALLIVFNFYPRGLFFLPGVFANLYQERFHAHRSTFRFPFVALIVFLVAWRATNVDLSQPSSQLVYWLFEIQGIYFIIAFAAALYLICAVILGTGMFGRMLISRTLLFMGAISYSFYLWHPIVVVAAKRLAQNVIQPHWGANASGIFFVASSLLASILVSWLSWLFFEKRLGTYLKSKIRKPINTESYLTQIVTK